MKRKAGKMFIRVFLKSFFVVIVLLTTGVLSYKAAVKFWQPSDQEEQVSIQDKGPTAVKNATIKGVSKNLIYCYNKKDKEITKLVLEILNSNQKKLTYITIPVRTQYTMSNVLYNNLTLDDPEIPQVLKLSTITKYLGLNKAFEDEAKIVEEMLETDINYYTAIPEGTYEKMFTEKSIKQDNGYDAVPEEIFTYEYKQQLRTLDSKKKLIKYIDKIYPKLQSDLSIKDKKKLAGSYNEISVDDINFDLVKGVNLNNGYVIDTELALEQLSKYSTVTSE